VKEGKEGKEPAKTNIFIATRSPSPGPRNNSPGPGGKHVAHEEPHKVASAPVAHVAELARSSDSLKSSSDGSGAGAPGPKKLDKSLFEGVAAAGAGAAPKKGLVVKPHVRAATDEMLPSPTASAEGAGSLGVAGRNRGVSMVPKVSIGLPMNPSRMPGAGSGMERSASDGGESSSAPNSTRRARPTTMALGGAFASQLNAMIGKGPADKAKDPATFVTDEEPTSTEEAPKLHHAALTRPKGRAGRRPPTRLMSSSSSSGAKPGDLIIPSNLESMTEEELDAAGAGQ
jgi:hypothetical protein